MFERLEDKVHLLKFVNLTFLQELQDETTSEQREAELKAALVSLLNMEKKDKVKNQQGFYCEGL